MLKRVTVLLIHTSIAVVRYETSIQELRGLQRTVLRKSLALIPRVNPSTKVMWELDIVILTHSTVASVNSPPLRWIWNVLHKYLARILGVHHSTKVMQDLEIVILHHSTAAFVTSAPLHRSVPHPSPAPIRAVKDPPILPDDRVYVVLKIPAVAIVNYQHSVLHYMDQSTSMDTTCYTASVSLCLILLDYHA